MSSRDTTPKKKSRHKEALQPISMDEILAGSGMSGFVSILDPPEEVPHLQALVDDITGVLPGRTGAQEPPGDTGPVREAGTNVIHLRRAGLRRGTSAATAVIEENTRGVERDTPPPLPRLVGVERAAV